jgi:tetratricopeptide (TPR) repeat protein
MASALSRLLTLKQIRHLAGERSFQRGQDYCAGGQVRSLVAHGDTLTATVIGTENYAVRLAAENGALQYRCSCPVGADGLFCKHCVATALAWLDAGRTGVSNPKSGISNSSGRAGGLLVSLDDLRPWLLGQPPATLAGHLLETAERDDRLREKLLHAAARATAKGIDFSAYRQSIDRATRTGGFIDYYGAGGYAEGVREAVEPLRELLSDTPEQAAAVIDLTEHALGRVEDAMENADDSNGEIGTLLGELQELHLEACHVAKPDPEELARRLFEWEMADHWDVFYNAAETYAEILGTAGLAVYRRLAEAAWKKLPALKPGAREGYDSNRFRLTNMMEALTRTSGDVDALADIKAKNLSSPYHYLTIAELYREAKRPDDALDWAERGLKAFPKTDDMRLLEFIADEYHRRKHPDEALALIWRPFEADPALADYQRLKQHADRAGVWPRWRECAQAGLRRRIAAETGGKSGRADPWGRHSARATLVQVFLWEENPEAAWEAGHGHPLGRNLTLELAAAREKTHPADVIPIYLQEAGTLIAQTGKRAYEEAIGHLKKAKALHLRLGLTDEWGSVIVRFREQHKAKRNFIALASGL